jgi:hypothetical protein
MSSISAARLVIEQFERSTIQSSWKQITQAEVATGLKDRVANPDLMDSRKVNLCGPAAFFNNLAKDDPVMYAKIGVDLYGRNLAKLGSRQFCAGRDLMNTRVPSGMNAVDWMTMASLRSDQNKVLSYDDPDEVGISGLTAPGAVEEWFEQAGFQSVDEEANVFFTKSVGNIKDASELWSRGHRVCLLVNFKMLEVTTQGHRSLFPDHWVVLRSPVTIANSTISFKVWYWGGLFTVPDVGTLSVDDFEKNYYGYVSAQPT